MESMGKVRLLNPQKGGSLIREIMIMIKVLLTSIQGQTAKWVEKKNIIIKKSHGLVREGKVGFHFCAFSKEKNQK